MVKHGVFISPKLESVPGRDRQTERQTDGRTDRITIASMRLAVRAVAGKNGSIGD